MTANKSVNSDTRPDGPRAGYLKRYAAMGRGMSTDVRRNHEIATPLRVLFGLIAVAMLLRNSPWSQPNQLPAITGYAGALVWGVLAVFGNKAGWQRVITMAVVIVYVVLVSGRPLGFAV